ncbi:MAG: hypothetical protein BVN35_06205 [Proteobacteria bacterium ST_bin11]|nr:MAG: hypothetical protein BVN35_06205 [Proteobacteria bacterium ST_bin11]
MSDFSDSDYEFLSSPDRDDLDDDNSPISTIVSLSSLSSSSSTCSDDEDVYAIEEPELQQQRHHSQTLQLDDDDDDNEEYQQSSACSSLPPPSPPKRSSFALSFVDEDNSEEEEEAPPPMQPSPPKPRSHRQPREEFAPLFPSIKEKYFEAFENNLLAQQQFSIGIPKFAHLTSVDQLMTLPPDVIGYFHKVCVTVTEDECTAGSTFGSMAFNNVSGRTKLMELVVFINAFCSPAIGSYSNMHSITDLPTASTFFSVAETSRSFKKVYTIVEPLFRRTHTDEGIVFSIEDLYSSLNVRGYRVWFLFADPKIIPLQALFDYIERQNKNVGNDAQFLPVTRQIIENHMRIQFTNEVLSIPVNSLLSEEEIEEHVQQKIEQYASKNLSQLNNRVMRSNENRSKTREAFAKSQAASSSSTSAIGKLAHGLGHDITSPLDLYNIFVCYENRCLNEGCSEKICDECLELQPVEQYFCSLTEADDDVDIDAICYRPLLDHSITGGNLATCGKRRSFAACHVYALINPTIHFTMDNPAVLKRLRSEGINICETQLDENNYTRSGTDEQDPYSYFTTPFDQCVFGVSAEVLTHKNFFTMVKPWCTDNTSSTLKLLTTAVSERQRAHIQAHNNTISSTVNVDSESFRAAVMFDRQWANVMPEPIAQKLRSQPYVEKNVFKLQQQLCLSSMLNKPGQANAVVRIMHDFDRARINYHNNLTKLQELAPYLCKEDIRDFTALLQTEGMRVFKSYFTENGDSTELLQGCARRLNSKTQKGESIFYELPQIAWNIDSTFANYMLWQYTHMENIGIHHFHTIAILMRLAVLRSTHCHHTDKLFNQPTIIPNYNLFGYAGTGKSYVLKMVQMITNPDAFQVSMTSSSCAPFSYSSKDGIVKVEDEYTPFNDATKEHKPPEAVTALSVEKGRVTEHEVSRNLLTMGNSNVGGVASVIERKSMTIITPHHGACLKSGNDEFYLGEDTSVKSRERTILIPAKMKRLGASSVSEQSIQFGTGRVDSILASTGASHTAMLQESYDVHFAYVHLMRTGGAPYPCLDLLASYWSAVYSALAAVFPFIEKIPRATERIYADGITLTIDHAIYLIRNTILSPLCLMNTDGTITKQPYTHDQLKLISPLTFTDGDTAIFAITLGVFTEIFVPRAWTIIFRLAEALGKITSKAPKYAQFRDEATNETYINRNFIDLGKVSDIITWLESACHFNRPMAASWVTYISEMSVVIDWQNPVNPNEQLQKRAVNVFTLSKANDKFSSNARVVHVESKVSLAVDFLCKGTTNNILEIMMNAICHKDIRPRTVLIGDTVEFLPFLPQTYDVRPKGKHSLLAKKSTASRNYIDTIVLGHNVISAEATAMRNAARKHASTIAALPMEYVDEHGNVEKLDVETALAYNWLKESPYIPEGMDVRRYFPVNIERDLRKLYQDYSIRGKIKYPDAAIEEYKKTHAAEIAREQAEERRQREAEKLSDPSSLPLPPQQSKGFAPQSIQPDTRKRRTPTPSQEKRDSMRSDFAMYAKVPRTQ